MKVPLGPHGYVGSDGSSGGPQALPGLRDRRERPLLRSGVVALTATSCATGPYIDLERNNRKRSRVAYARWARSILLALRPILLILIITIPV